MHTFLVANEHYLILSLDGQMGHGVAIGTGSNLSHIIVVMVKNKRFCFWFLDFNF
jgi:hypothetical protein